MACGNLVPQPGIEPPVVEVQSLNHWTTREVPKSTCLFFFIFVYVMRHVGGKGFEETVSRKGVLVTFTDLKGCAITTYILLHT